MNIFEITKGMTENEILKCLKVSRDGSSVFFDIGEEIYECPNMLGLINPDTSCTLSCEECWKQSLINSGVLFKSDIPTYDTLEESGIEGIELTDEESFEYNALRGVGDIVTLRAWGSEPETLDETKVRMLADWFAKVVDYLDYIKSIDEKNKTILTKEELSLLTGIKIIDK